MATAKRHPCNSFSGWLHVSAEDNREAMVAQCRMRDLALEMDRNASGEPPGFRDWSIQQVRGIAHRPGIARQIAERREHLHQLLARTELERDSMLEAIATREEHLREQLALLDELQRPAALEPPEPPPAAPLWVSLPPPH